MYTAAKEETNYTNRMPVIFVVFYSAMEKNVLGPAPDASMRLLLLSQPFFLP